MNTGELIVLFYLMLIYFALVAAAYAMLQIVVGLILVTRRSPHVLRFLRWFLGLGEALDRAPQLKAAVVIPAYNEETTLRETIRSVKAQTYAIAQIIVVDDCSQDQTGKIAHDEGVMVLRTPENTGSKARALNHALAQLDTDIMITVDADTRLVPDSVEKLMCAFGSEKTAGACGFVMPQKIHSLWERGRFVEYLYSLAVHKGAQSTFRTILVANGCFCAFRVDLLRKYGGFPPRTLAEDMDITWQFLEAGLEVKFVAEALCLPLDPHDYPTFKRQVERWYRSYLQNISVHRRMLWQNKRLSFFVAWYLVRGLLMPPLLMALALWILWSHEWLLIWAWLAPEFVLVAMISAVQGARKKRFVAALSGILPYYLVIRSINMYLFWRSVWLEWVRRRRLDHWDKGHFCGVADGEKVAQN